MARWRMIEPGYLRTDPPTEWEHKETDQTDGRQRRKVYEVPLYIEREQIVSDGNNSQPGDIIFVGSPTPTMQPLDDEAVKLSQAEEHKWIHPIESLPSTGAFLPAVDYGVPPPPAMPRAPIRRL